MKSCGPVDIQCFGETCCLYHWGRNEMQMPGSSYVLVTIYVITHKTRIYSCTVHLILFVEAAKVIFIYQTWNIYPMRMNMLLGVMISQHVKMTMLLERDTVSIYVNEVYGM
jgi:hypothetical protein